VKIFEDDVPPPGVGLNTVMEAVPDVVISEAGIDAVNCVAETKVVVRLDPFQRTTEPATNPVPLTVSMNDGPREMVAVGFRLVIVGAGLLIVKVREPEVPPPGVELNTVTDAVPAAAMSVAGIVTVS
jgi:hypothetical protein